MRTIFDDEVAHTLRILLFYENTICKYILFDSPYCAYLLQVSDKGDRGWGCLLCRL